MVITTKKIIGLHIGRKMNSNFNLGKYLKIPLIQFLNTNKDYINQKGLSPSNYSSNNYIYSVKSIFNINKDDSEKIKELENKLKEVNEILKDRVNRTNSIIAKNQKTIDELKEKLSRFPFELLKGEKLMSIIVESSDKKLQRAIVCKNTELFCDLEKKFIKKMINILMLGIYLH